MLGTSLQTYTFLEPRYFTVQKAEILTYCSVNLILGGGTVFWPGERTTSTSIFLLASQLCMLATIAARAKRLQQRVKYAINECCQESV